MEREQKNHFLKIRIRSFAACGVLTALILSAGCGTAKGGMTPVPGGASSNQSSRAVTAAPADEKERAEYSGTAAASGEEASGIPAAAGKTSADAVTAGERRQPGRRRRRLRRQEKQQRQPGRHPQRL